MNAQTPMTPRDQQNMTTKEAEEALKPPCPDTSELTRLQALLRQSQEEREAIAHALLASGEYVVTGENGQPVSEPYNLVERAKSLINERAQLRHKLSQSQEENRRLRTVLSAHGVKFCPKCNGVLEFRSASGFDRHGTPQEADWDECTQCGYTI